MKRIAVVIQSRANYARIKSVLDGIKNSKVLDLQLIVGGSAVLRNYGDIRETLSNDAFEITSTIFNVVRGDGPVAMAKSTGLGIIDLANQFEMLKPDAVLTVADRHETLATAVSASYLNIPLIHTQGGEVTGSIDESVRHAITKLAHLHFPATSRAKKFLLNMGENESTVHKVGCPAIDLLLDISNFNQDIVDVEVKQGTGFNLDSNDPFLIVLQHAVTTECELAGEQITHTLEAIKRIDMQTIWLWPNIDSGSDAISKKLREYKETNNGSKIHFYRNFTPETYAYLLKNAKCIVGNSSSGIREASFLGTPTVNVGSRQRDRERGPNVIDVPHDVDMIVEVVNKQLKHGVFEQSTLFGDGYAGQKITKIIEEWKPNINKRLSYLD